MRKLFRRNRERKSKIGIIITNHIINNKKDYLISILIFLIGLIIGIMFINNIDDDRFAKINEYIKSLVSNMQTVENIDYMNLLRESMLSNFILILIIWISSSTIIGIPIVYGTLGFRGFVLGYTISSIITTLGMKYGMMFGISSLLLHNIIFIPVLLATCVSGMKLYKYIIKNREKSNIKTEFFRHTIFCVLMLLLLVISTVIEVYISTNLAKFIVKYIKI